MPLSVSWRHVGIGSVWYPNQFPRYASSDLLRPLHAALGLTRLPRNPTAGACAPYPDLVLWKLVFLHASLSGVRAVCLQTL